MEAKIQTATPQYSTTATAAASSSADSDEHTGNATATTPSATSAIVPADTAAEWSKALSHVDPLQRSLSIGKLIAGLAPENAHEIAGVFAAAHKTGARYKSEHMTFMRAWGAAHGAEALQHAVESNGKTDGSPIVLAAMAGWASSNPLTARNWAEALPDGQEKEDIMVGMLDGWATVDLEAASRYIETRPRTPARNRTRQMLLERALINGGIPGAAIGLARSMAKARTRCASSLPSTNTTRMLDHDTESTALWIKEQDGAGIWPAVPFTIPHVPVSANLAETIEFAGSLEQMKKGGHRQLQRIINEWAQKDPRGRQWLNEHGSLRHDVMVNRYITTISDIDPETALQWAGTIGNENRRKNSMLIAAAGLLETEGEAAVAKLKALGMTEGMIKAARSTQS